MEQSNVAQQYLDLMARAFSVLTTQSEEDLSLIKATGEYTAIFVSIKERFSGIIGKDAETLLETINALINEMDGADWAQKPLYAEAICLCMDQQISYLENPTIWENGRISLFDILPAQDDNPIILLNPLNNNWKDTGVCIMPRFPTSMAQTQVGAELKDRLLSGRNMLYGINQALVNVGYYPWNKDTPNVQHIILSDRHLPSTHNLASKTRIAFSPLSDCDHLLDDEYRPQTAIGGRICTGIFVNGVNEEETLNQKYTRCWERACTVFADVFFAPEMIATDDMISVENLKSNFLNPLLRKAVLNGKVPPRLTVMPTYWRNRENRLFVFDDNGNYIGTQFKRKPFINEKGHSAEALNIPPENTDILLIHLKNKQRIAFAICSEFLIGQEDYVSDFLCKKLGATLVLVPSYSLGEQDFITAINAVKRFGTSVVWGNCCGAVPAKDGQPVERIVGACSYAGADEIHRFGSVKKCNSSCDGVQSCVFCIELPTRVAQNKPDAMPMPDILHLCD